jgi:hypothetical protein
MDFSYSVLNKGGGYYRDFYSVIEIPRMVRRSSHDGLRSV